MGRGNCTAAGRPLRSPRKLPNRGAHARRIAAIELRLAAGARRVRQAGQIVMHANAVCVRVVKHGPQNRVTLGLLRQQRQDVRKSESRAHWLRSVGTRRGCPRERWASGRTFHAARARPSCRAECKPSPSRPVAAPPEQPSEAGWRLPNRARSARVNPREEKLDGSWRPHFLAALANSDVGRDRSAADIKRPGGGGLRGDHRHGALDAVEHGGYYGLLGRRGQGKLSIIDNFVQRLWQARRAGQIIAKDLLSGVQPWEFRKTASATRSAGP